VALILRSLGFPSLRWRMPSKGFSPRAGIRGFDTRLYVRIAVTRHRLGFVLCAEVSVPERGFVALIHPRCVNSGGTVSESTVSVPERGFVALIRVTVRNTAGRMTIGLPSFSPRAGIRGFDTLAQADEYYGIEIQKWKFRSPSGDSWL
jgi:hypothetical protein